MGLESVECYDVMKRDEIFQSFFFYFETCIDFLIFWMLRSTKELEIMEN